jgi:hypothetical protein
MDDFSAYEEGMTNHPNIEELEPFLTPEDVHDSLCFLSPGEPLASLLLDATEDADGLRFAESPPETGTNFERFVQAVNCN